MNIPFSWDVLPLPSWTSYLEDLRGGRLGLLKIIHRVRQGGKTYPGCHPRCPPTAAHACNNIALFEMCVQGWAKVCFPGSVDMRTKLCVLLLAVGRKTQNFHLIFTEPGKRTFAHPCKIAVIHLKLTGKCPNSSSHCLLRPPRTPPWRRSSAPG